MDSSGDSSNATEAGEGVTGESATTSDATADPSTDAPPADRRDVIVPLAIYKRVTVVSTVMASALVVCGFLLLDAATKQTRLLRQPIVVGLQWLGVDVAPGTLSVALGVGGLGVIVVGAAIYVFGARFRTEGMGSDKTDADGDDDNG